MLRASSRVMPESYGDTEGMVQIDHELKLPESSVSGQLDVGVRLPGSVPVSSNRKGQPELHNQPGKVEENSEPGKEFVRSNHRDELPRRRMSTS